MLLQEALDCPICDVAPKVIIGFGLVSSLAEKPGVALFIAMQDDVFSAAEVQERSTSLASLQADLVTDARKLQYNLQRD